MAKRVSTSSEEERRRATRSRRIECALDAEVDRSMVWMQASDHEQHSSARGGMGEPIGWPFTLLPSADQRYGRRQQQQLYLAAVRPVASTSPLLMMALRAVQQRQWQ